MNTVKEVLNDEGKVIGEVVNGDPKHPESWELVFDEQGKLIGVTYAQDPKHSGSWMNLYDDQRKCVGRTYGQNPKDSRSWVDIYDGNGQHIGIKYGNERVKWNHLEMDPVQKNCNENGVLLGEAANKGPKNLDSWGYVFNEQGERVGIIYS